VPALNYDSNSIYELVQDVSLLIIQYGSVGQRLFAKRSRRVVAAHEAKSAYAD
jgi:hypothetical protein